MQVKAEWLESENLQALMSAVASKWEVFCVGGCVRDAVIGRPVNDVDLATSATPEQVTKAVSKLGVNVLPTGIEHGTVTVVFDNGETYEVTTYRKDVETDGRRATIAFADTVVEDAQRRDFTMNALYMDRDGVVTDPTGQGIADLQAMRIRFVGNADDRCKEDYLRIMRLFRFHAQLGFSITADAVRAAQANAEGLDKVSGERKFWELKKILGTAEPFDAVSMMQSTGVLAKVMPGHRDSTELARMNVVEVQGNLPPTWMRRYVAISADAKIPFPCAKWEKIYVEELLNMRESTPFEKVAVTAYKTKHPELTADSFILTQGYNRFPWKDPGKQIDIGMSAVCPLKAEDLMEVGMVPGREMGRALRDADEAFCMTDFGASKTTLLDMLFNTGFNSQMPNYQRK